MPARGSRQLAVRPFHLIPADARNLGRAGLGLRARIVRSHRKWSLGRRECPVARNCQFLSPPSDWRRLAARWPGTRAPRRGGLLVPVEQSVERSRHDPPSRAAGASSRGDCRGVNRLRARRRSKRPRPRPRLRAPLGCRANARADFARANGRRS